jgi:glutaredoxin
VKQPRLALFVLLAAVAGSAAAQQIYRWVDDKGRVQVTDSPPPAGAKNVQKSEAPVEPSGGEQLPFELRQAAANFPVVLYSSPNCQEGCSRARDALNRRGVPFKEVSVTDAAGIEELKKVSGGNQVPVLTVGRSVQKGFEQGALDALLDSAQYPREGVLPPRRQAAPQPAAPAKPAAQAQAPEPRGPYSPKAPSKPQAEPPKLYNPVPGKDKPLSGPYGKGADEAPPAASAQGSQPQAK